MMKKYCLTASHKFYLYLGCMVFLFFILSGCGMVNDIPQDLSETCSACKLYKFFFSVIGEIAEQFFNKSRKMALDLLALGGLLYFASFAYKLSAGFLGQGDRDVLKLKDDLFKTIFKIIIVALLLSSKDMFLSIIDFVVVPVLEAFIGVSQTIILKTEGVLNTKLTPVSINPELTDFSAIFSDKIGQPIQQLIYQVWQTLQSGQTLWVHVVRSADVANIFVGGGVMCLFFFMGIFVPFIFIDAFFRLGFLLIVSPLVIICIPFQATKKTTKTAWDILCGSMMQILIACIFISLMIIILHDYYIPTEQVDAWGGLQTGPLQIFLLIYCLSKMMKNVPVLARYFGGDGASGSINQIGKALRSGLGSALAGVASPTGPIREGVKGLGELGSSMLDLSTGAGDSSGE